MKSIDELDYKYLRFNILYHFANKSLIKMWKPRSFGPLLLITYLGHLAYYWQQNDFVFETSAVLQSFTTMIGNVGLLVGTYLAIQCLLGILQETANVSFVAKFMKKNDIEPYAKQYGWWTAETPVTKETKEKLPPSVRGQKEFRPLPSYSFDIKTSAGSKVSLSQFVYTFPLYIPADFYFLALKMPYAKRTKAKAVYLDNYKNGRSVMRLLRRPALELEGNFSDYFRLYHPDGDEIPAREILAPDVMDFLIAENTPFDYEFSGGYVWIIAKGYHLNKRDLKRLCAVADKLAAE